MMQLGQQLIGRILILSIISVQTVVERYTQLAAVRYVDEIICYATESDLIDILQMYPINVRILGDEYKNKDFNVMIKINNFNH